MRTQVSASLLVLLGLFADGRCRRRRPPASGKTAEENYKATCQPCHMADGNAALKPMNFADGEWKHGTTPQALAKVITDGVPGTAMMPFKTRFSEQEILELAKYVRKFDPKLKGAPRPRRRKPPSDAVASRLASGVYCSPVRRTAACSRCRSRRSRRQSGPAHRC